MRFAIGRIEPGDVLEIHDVAGRRVDTVPLGAESGVVTWDGHPAGAGVYFARVRSASGPGRGVRFVLLR